MSTRGDTFPALGATPVVSGITSLGVVTPILVDTDGTLQTDASVSSGTEYTEGATDATITGTAVLWEDAADTLRAVSLGQAAPGRDHFGRRFWWYCLGG